MKTAKLLYDTTISYVVKDKHYNHFIPRYTFLVVQLHNEGHDLVTCSDGNFVFHIPQNEIELWN
jgi:hypothetical protein